MQTKWNGYSYDYNIGNMIIDDNIIYNKAIYSYSNKLNDYQYQVFILYLITDDIIKDTNDFTLKMDNMVLMNGADITKENADNNGMYIISGSDNKRFIETDSKFDIKLSREKTLEDSKIYEDLDVSIDYRNMHKKIDKVIVGPTQTVIKLSTKITDVSLKALSSPYYITNHIETHVEYKVFNQEGSEINNFSREMKRTVQYSNGKTEEWGTGDIGTWKDFENATMYLEEYIVFETNDTTNKIIIEPSISERIPDKEKSFDEKTVKLDNLEIEL